MTDLPVANNPRARFSIGNPPKAPDPTPVPASPPDPSVSVSGGHEREPTPVPPDDVLFEDMETTSAVGEMERKVAAVVQIVAEQVVIPPDVTQLTHAGPTAPVILEKDSGPDLPLNDQQIGWGLQQVVSRSIRWLATWCVRQLKIAQWIIVNNQGSIKRVRNVQN